MVLRREVLTHPAGRERRRAPFGGGFLGRTGVHRRSMSTARARWRCPPPCRGPAHGLPPALRSFCPRRCSRRCPAPHMRAPASWRGSRWRGCRSVVHDEAWERAANWKILFEGGLESYHFRVAHRDTIGPFFQDNLSSYRGFGRHIRSILPRAGLDAMIAQPKESWSLRRATNLVYSVFPAAQLLVQEDHIVWIQVLPLAPDRTQLRLATLVPAESDPPIPKPRGAGARITTSRCGPCPRILRSARASRAACIPAPMRNCISAAPKARSTASTGPLRTNWTGRPESGNIARRNWGGQALKDTQKILSAVAEKLRKVNQYRENVAADLGLENSQGADVRLLVVADHLWGFGQIAPCDRVVSDFGGFNAVYFFSFPETIIPLVQPEPPAN